MIELAQEIVIHNHYPAHRILKPISKTTNLNFHEYFDQLEQVLQLLFVNLSLFM